MFKQINFAKSQYQIRVDEKLKKLKGSEPLKYG